MKPSHDLFIQDRCTECGLRKADFFCRLANSDLERFQAIKVTKAYPRGTMLFVEGQPADAVYMLCQGKVKLSACSASGKIMILGIADAGEVLGLSAVLNGSEYEMTAEVLELCQVNFVAATDLLQFIRSTPQACLNAARQLSRNYQTAYRQVCTLGLSDSIADKLANLFLDWAGKENAVNGRVRVRNFFTHEEIAEMIGASRETVTRALRFFRESELVTLKGSELIIHDRNRLREMVGEQNGHRREM